MIRRLFRKWCTKNIQKIQNRKGIALAVFFMQSGILDFNVFLRHTNLFSMRRFFILTVFLSFFANSLFAGWIIRMQNYSYGSPTLWTYTVAPGYLKISVDKRDFIYDAESKQIRIVYHRIRSYYAGSFEDYKSDLKILNEFNADIADLILPQSWFYSFEKLLEGRISDNRNEQLRTAAGIKVKNSGTRSNIAGEDAREYQLYLDTVLLEQVWLASGVNLRDDLDFISAVNFFRGISGTGLDGMNQFDLSAFEQLAYRGFPMKIVQYDNLGMVSFREECLMIQKQDIDIETTFFPPASYVSRTLTDVIIAE
jgi:hypothetical protein